MQSVSSAIWLKLWVKPIWVCTFSVASCHKILVTVLLDSINCINIAICRLLVLWVNGHQ